jgi:hypothetical protein
MQTLFHYCSSSSFASIISTKTIRLSSLTCSNDAFEGKVVKDILSGFAENVEGEHPHFKTIFKVLDSVFTIYDGLGFCLSEDGDLLSQWRGYADNGQGLSIGFNQKYFEKLSKKLKSEDTKSFSLRQVLYERNAQEERLRPLYNGLMKGFNLEKAETNAGKANKLRTVMTILQGIMESSIHLFDLKSPAFSEEKEWRLIAGLVKAHEPGDKADCQFKASPDRLVPYRLLNLEKIGIPVINKIILGPKHRSDEGIIRIFLRNFGFGEVEVIKSKVPYQ